MHDSWVSLKLDPGRCDNSPELLSCQGPKPNRYHGIQLPVALKDGQVLGTAIGCLWTRQNFQGMVRATCSMVPQPQGPLGERGGYSLGGSSDAGAANSSMPRCQPEGGGR